MNDKTKLKKEKKEEKMERDKLVESFNTRIKNSLKRENIFTTEQLIQKSEIELLDFTNLWITSVANIVQTVEQHGFKLKENEPSQYSPRVRECKVLRLQEQKIKNTNLINKTKIGK